MSGLKNQNITCGIHYNALHQSKVFKNDKALPLSEYDAETTMSLPFHEALTPQDIKYIIQNVTLEGVDYAHT